jgi:hypothetical protein
MSYKLAEVAVVEKRYWTIALYDEFSPDGEELSYRHETKEAAEANLQSFIDKKLATRRKI